MLGSQVGLPDAKDVFTAPSGDKTLVACGFCQAASTNSLARTIYGLLFVLRFVTFSERNNLRTDIRSKVVELLDQKSIQHASNDLVRFS